MHDPALQVRAQNTCQDCQSKTNSSLESSKAAVLFCQPQSLCAPQTSSDDTPNWENLFILASTAASVEQGESIGHHVRDIRQVTSELSRQYECGLSGPEGHRVQRPHYSSGLEPPFCPVVQKSNRESALRSSRKVSLEPTKCVKSRAHFGEISRLRRVQRDIIQLFVMEAKSLQERVIRKLLGDSPDTSKALRRLCSLQILKRFNCGGRKTPFEYKLEETPATWIKLQELINATHGTDVHSNSLQIFRNNKPILQLHVREAKACEP